MSDWLQFVVDEKTTLAGAAKRAEKVRKRLVADGWIVATSDEDGHRPGSEVASWYTRAKREVDFTKLATNVVAIEAGPFTNLAAGPFDVDTLRCPRCKAKVDEDTLMESVGEWMSGEGTGLYRCLRCKAKPKLRELQASKKDASPVVCGNFVLTFHNWPPLEDRRWKKSVVDTIAEAIGERPSIGWAKV